MFGMPRMFYKFVEKRIHPKVERGELTIYKYLLCFDREKIVNCNKKT